MPLTIEVCARKVNDAIEEGLAKLNKTLDDVDVKIISQGGLFRKAKVQLTVIGSEDESQKITKEEPKQEKPAQKEFIQKPVQKSDNAPKKEFAPKTEKQAEKSDAQQSQKQRPERKFQNPKPRKVEEKKEQEAKKEQKPEQSKVEQPKVKREEKPRNAVTDEVKDVAVNYLSQLIKHMGVEAEIKPEIKDGNLVLEICTENSAVIGYRGETLDSIEYLVSLAINKNENTYYKVTVNSNGYREKREKLLVELAEKMAAKCIKQNRKVVLEPMNSSGRKIIHAALSNNEKVITRSEGHEPNRRVVIFAVRNKK